MAPRQKPMGRADSACRDIPESYHPAGLGFAAKLQGDREGLKQTVTQSHLSLEERHPKQEKPSAGGNQSRRCLKINTLPKAIVIWEDPHISNMAMNIAAQMPSK